MSKDLFRKKSLDKISLPEQTNDYIMTSNIPSWIILVVVLILLCGAFVWSVFGNVDIAVKTIAVSDGKKSVCYVRETDMDAVKETSKIVINQVEYAISDVSEIPFLAEKHLSDYEMHLGEFSDDEWLYELTIDADFKSGLYDANIVFESVYPISLIMN